MPHALGGKDNIDNLQLTCSRCNILKAAKPIYSEAFEKYIEAIIENSDKYNLIKWKNLYERGFDLLIKCKGKFQFRFLYKIMDVKNLSF